MKKITVPSILIGLLFGILHSMEHAISSSQLPTNSSVTISVKENFFQKKLLYINRDLLTYIPLIDRELKYSQEPNKISISGITSKDLQFIIQATQAVYQEHTIFLKQHSEFFQKYGLDAIPSHIAQIIHPMLRQKKDKDLVNLMNAANYLGMTWLVNTMACFWIRNKKTITLAQKIGLNADIIENYLDKYVTKTNHHELKMTEVIQISQPEVSIADIILDSLLPAIEDNELNLSSKNITSVVGLDLIPHKIAITIHSLNLGFNRIMFIPSHAFFMLSNLKALQLNNNEIVTIARLAFSGLAQLQELYLHRNKIASIDPDNLTILKNIKTIDLSNNQLTDQNKQQIRQALPNANIEF